MTDLTPTAGLDAVPQLETNTQALGGPGGPMNLQAQALLNRIQWLLTNVPTPVATAIAAVIASAITSGDTTHAPSGGAVFTALAGKQPIDATLTALAAANWAANALPIGSGADTLSQVAFAANTFPARASTGNLVAKVITDFALTLLDDVDAATMRATLGLPVLDNGTYTPTLTSIANVASTTASALQYMRVGNTVTVSGKLTVTPTAGSSTLTRIGISLPIASALSNSGSVGGGGAAGQTPFAPALIVGDTTNNRAELQFYSSATASTTAFFSFTYLVS